MKIALVYCSTHGCVKKSALHLSELLNSSNVQLIDLKTKPQVNVNDFDAIILGGSIHAGRIQRHVTHFCKTQLHALLERPIGLFICCMFEGDTALEQFANAFPAPLRDHAVAHGLFGGEFDFEKMNIFEKAIVKQVAGVEKSISQIDFSSIEKFAQELNSSIAKD